jgi:hypothetical protein
MAKIKLVHSSQRKTASKKQKNRAPEKRPRQGLAFINAAYQRKTAAEPDLKRELKMLRHSNDVGELAALYNAYRAAANAILAIENQPRAEGVDHLLEAEWNWLILKAWTVAEQLKTMRPTKHSRDHFLRVLVDCAFEMDAGGGGRLCASGRHERWRRRRCGDIGGSLDVSKTKPARAGGLSMTSLERKIRSVWPNFVPDPNRRDIVPNREGIPQHLSDSVFKGRIFLEKVAARHCGGFWIPQMCQR